MQVRKFEAPSMKEAIELVKIELGPEAIILGTRDLKVRGGHGRSTPAVEVTAAISELQLSKRKLAETKMPQKMRDNFRGRPASSQKEFIDRVFEKRMASAQGPVAPEERAIASQAPRAQKGPTKTRYIDIDSQEATEPKSLNPKAAARGALASRAKATQAMHQEDKRAQGEIEVLRREIENLQKFISDMAKTPKTTTQLHPGAELGISYDLTDAYQKLVQTGLSPTTVIQMMELTQKTLAPEQLRRKHLVEAYLTREILGRIRIQEHPFQRGTHFLVGPSGQGKTSSLVKIASRIISERRETVAILTTDTRKVGAVDQLRIYSQIMNVPFGVLRSAADWEEIQIQLQGVDVILVDTGGTALKNLEELESLQQFLPRQSSAEVHYVLSATQREHESSETLRRFRALNPVDLIFTHVEESARYGGMVNLSLESDIPIVGLSLGRSIPDDYEWANRERILDLLLKISNSKPLGNRT